MRKGLCVDEGGLFVCAPNPISSLNRTGGRDRKRHLSGLSTLRQSMCPRPAANAGGLRGESVGGTRHIVDIEHEIFNTSEKAEITPKTMKFYK